MNLMLKNSLIAVAILLFLACSDDNISGNGTGDSDSANSTDSNDLGDTDADSESVGDSGGDTDSDSDTDSDTGPDWNACASEDFSMELLPLDILLALDTSYSMDFSPEGQGMNKWEAVRQAVKRFVAAPGSAGIAVGLQYFPIRKMCSVDEYAIPAVPISMLPGAADALAASLDAQRMAEGTPMFPLLKGALQYTAAWATDHPDRKTVVVMATDGIPDSTCLSSNPADSNTIANVEKIAGEAAVGLPAINTFVIGVGSELTALNRISQAGNGQNAILIDMAGADVEQALLEALESIRRRSICEYNISDISNGKPIDLKKVNILLSSTANEELPLTFVNAEKSCELAPEKGWYYDDQKSPKRILLCPQTCERVQADPSNTLKIVLGCNTVTID